MDTTNQTVFKAFNQKTFVNRDFLKFLQNMGGFCTPCSLYFRQNIPYYFNQQTVVLWYFLIAQKMFKCCTLYTKNIVVKACCCTSCHAYSQLLYHKMGLYNIKSLFRWC